MAFATFSTRSSERWGRLWGSKPWDWAACEEQQLPTYEAALDRLDVGAGQRVLDVGCGSGVLLRAAADRGATVYGLDASTGLLDVARTRVPDADLRVGDMEALPYDDDTFDVVCGFNSFFFADDMVAALAEAGRVAKPGARLLIQVFGRPERCSLMAMKGAAEQFLPAPPPGSPLTASFWQPGALESLAARAGLEPREAFDVTWAYDFVDDDDLLRSMLAAGSSVLAASIAGEDAVRAALLEALEPFRTAAGGYRLENEWHCLIAAA